MQNAATSGLLPVHSDCKAIRDVRRRTFTSFSISFSRSILHLSPAAVRSRYVDVYVEPHAAAVPSTTTTARMGSLVLKISRQLMSRDPDHRRRRIFGQLGKQSAYRRLELA